jgi:hypothetical protein
MLKKSFLGAFFGAALLACSSAEAGTIVAYYSLDGGPITLAPNFGTSQSLVSTFSAMSSPTEGFFVNILQGTSFGSSLTSGVNSSHIGTGSDDLKVYILSVGNNPGGSLTFSSSFTQNFTGTSGILSTYLGSSPLASPFPPGFSPGDTSQLGLSILLGSVTFSSIFASTVPPNSQTASSNFSLTAVYDITASGGTIDKPVVSNATIDISSVPGPIVGAGLPGLIAACGGLLALARRRRKRAA